MAQRNMDKAKRPATREVALVDGLSDAVHRLEARASLLEHERDDLKGQLAAANARIAHLEQQRIMIANRIDWVIDSLHNAAVDDK